MKYLLLVLLAFSFKAQAGWLDRFCTHFLIADDPYQFEMAPRTWLEKELERYAVKENWNRLSPKEKRLQLLMKDELRIRDEWKGEPPDLPRGD